MLPKQTPPRGPSRSALALLTLLVIPFSARAEDPEKELEPIVVSALKFPQAAATATSAVTVLDPEELQNQGIFQLRDALNASPGVISTSTGGQSGAIGSLFIRGTNTGYSQFVLDGMRLSDSTTQLGNMLSGSRTYDVGNIEILRGPQGAIYGGESIGGVLWMETPHGSGDPHGTVSAEAGSFNSYATHATFQGLTKGVSYFLAGGYEESDNDGPNEQFHQASGALRVEGAIDPVWTVGTTYRYLNSFYNEHGNSDDHLDAALATVYANAEFSDRWTSRFLIGHHQELYDSASSFGLYSTDMRASSISTDQEITLTEKLRILAGAYVHNSAFENSIGTDEERLRYGGYAALEWEALPHWTTTGALRWEDYDAFGDEFTWRIGSVYELTSTRTRFRGGLGTSFRSPTYLDLFGSSFGAGDPNLKAESSFGWDLGIEQEIGTHHTIGVTWFRNQITDQIKNQAMPLPPANVDGQTATQGIELGLNGNFLDDAVTYRLAWTYLNKSLSEQPRNAATASIDWKPTAKSLVGIGATHLSAHSWGGDPLDSYTVARLYGSYQLTDRVKLHARVENVLDENYQLWSDSFGGPIEGAGTGLYAGVTVDW